jgi:hypothetical protein
MLNTVHIIRDPFCEDSNVTIDTDDVRATCLEQFETWPLNARLYHNAVADDCDVTPFDEAGVRRLGELQGTFFIVVYPGDITTILVGIVINIILAVAYAMLTPKPKTAADASTRADATPGSANNALSDRTNVARLNGRIPDIYGQVRSTPDLIVPPYSVFINNKEVEYSYMCIGVGTYDVTDIKEDTTLVSVIDGESVAIYGPNTSPMLNSTPQQTVGNAITGSLMATRRCSAANGQTLLPSNNLTHYFSSIHASYDSTTHRGTLVHSESGVNLTAICAVGDTINLLNMPWNVGYGGSLDGNYIVYSVNATTLVLSNVDTISANWSRLGYPYTNTYGNLSNTKLTYIGPFTVYAEAGSSILLNLVALNGVYLVDKTTGVQTAATVSISIGVTPLDVNGNPTGSMVTYTTSVVGSTINRDTAATTYSVAIATTSYYNVIVWRSSITGQGSVYSGEDETKWRDLIVATPISTTSGHFGNVTTLRAVTIATAGALAIQERKLNMLVTRKLPARVSGNTFSSTLYATKFAADIFCAVCLDTHIGRRNISELDVSNIYDTFTEVTTYFGASDAAEFSYTFDNINTSFEEILAAISSAAFCTAFRRGSMLRVSFEKQTSNSLLLFNHRNKLPGTEERAIAFGHKDDLDGIEYQFIDPADDVKQSYYLPLDRSSINNKVVDSIGVRNRLQAYMHAWREYNRMQYQNITTKFTATQEANMLVQQDRILVADNTRTGTQDGDILNQNGLTLTLSQNVNLTGGAHTIFIQYPNGTVGTHAVSAGGASNQVVLATAPAYTLSTDPNNFARATYNIVLNSSTREHAFLVLEKSAQSNYQIDLTCINYDDRVYGKDLDYVNNIIDLNAGIT